MDQTNSSQTSVPKSGPRDVFLHLLSVVTLYASVISFITLLWQYINIWLPDSLTFYYASAVQSIRWSASFLVVMFPVYLFVNWIINKGYTQEPARREIRVRKWLVYLTLFISAITVIIDVVVLVYNFLGGDVTLRFAMKVLAVLITAAVVFGYYFYDLKADGLKNRKLVAWIVSILVGVTIVGGFFIVGSPAHQRQLNFDTRRVSDLASIQSEVVYYWQQKGTLPATLSDLNNDISGFTVPRDPESNADYTYTVKSTTGFELCANFNLASQENSPYAPIPASLSVPSPGSLSAYSDNWSHGTGNVCFDRNIDPQLYKPNTSS